MLEELNSTMTRSKMLNEKIMLRNVKIKLTVLFDYLKFTFGTSKTVKIHTIESHFVDYVKLT